MFDIPEFMPALLTKCTPYGKSELVLRDMVHLSVGEIKREKTQQVTFSNILHQGYIFSYVHIFKHDEKNVYYVAEYPKKKLFFHSVSKVRPQHLTVGNIPDSVTDKAHLYKYLVYGISSKLFGTENSMQYTEDYVKNAENSEKLTVYRLEPKLYGPMDLDEILSQRALRYVLL